MSTHDNDLGAVDIGADAPTRRDAVVDAANNRPTERRAVPADGLPWNESGTGTEGMKVAAALLSALDADAVAAEVAEAG